MPRPRRFSVPTVRLVTAMPTFELLSGRAAMWGARVVDVPVDAELRLDLDQMAQRAAGAGLIYICNPNNPTGTVHGASDIEAFVTAALRTEPKATILIDEAYHEYVERADYKTAIPLALSNPRVVVSRTFSKIYGMAGLRVGYAVGQPRDAEGDEPVPRRRAIELPERAGGIDGAGRSGPSDRDARQQPRGARDDGAGPARCRLSRRRLRGQLRDGRRAARHPRLPAACRNRGVEIARPFPPLLTWARITIGTMAEMQQAVEALRGRAG